MDDLISRRKAINTVRDMFDKCDGDIETYRDLMVKSLEYLIAERKTGRWVKEDDEGCWWYECSECGDYPLENSYGHDVLSNFCPNCGADMRGGA